MASSSSAVVDEKALKELYYDVSSPACYAGVSTLLREAKKRGVSGVTRRKVEEFLAKQRTYSLHKPSRRKFPRNKVVAVGIDSNWQADLADLKKLARFNKNFKYLLTVVDVFSKYAWAIPVKSKRPEEVAAAFRSITRDSGRKPWWLYTDRGKEFVGRPFQEMAKDLGIVHVLTTSPDVKASNVERMNRTIKTRLWKYFTRRKTLKYLDVLQSIVDSVNRSYSRPIGCAPVEVTRENEDRIRKRLYGSIVAKQDFTFKVGDHVRIAKAKNAFAKGYVPNFTEEVFVVDKRLKRNPVVYKLKDLNSEDIEGIFYREELSKTTLDDDDD